MEKFTVKVSEMTECFFLFNSHPSIVGYKEAFFEDSSSCLCLVMDFLDDGDLYQKIVKF